MNLDFIIDQEVIEFPDNDSVFYFTGQLKRKKQKFPLVSERMRRAENGKEEICVFKAWRYQAGRVA